MAENDKVDSSSNINLISDLYSGETEKTYLESGYVQKSLLRPYNSDDLFQKAGDYSIYEDMANDDQINSIVQLKIDMIIGSGWCIEVDDDDQQEMADQIYKLLEQSSDVSLEECLEDILRTGFVNGFAIAEKIFKKTVNNELTLKALKNRYPNSWLIHTDPKGNITKYEQQGVERSNIEVDPRSLFHYINNPQYTNPYGYSDLRPAYKPWFVKTQVIKYYGIFLEKYASPIPHAKYKDGLSSEKQQELLDHIKRFQQKSAIVYPDTVEIDFLNASGDGSSYEKAINLFNMLIGRSMLLPDLSGMSGEKTSGGAFALGEKQMQSFLKHIEKRRRIIERMVNKHIIEPMVLWNFGQVEFYPKFKLKPISEDNSSEFARLFIEAIKGNLYKPSEEEINHLRSLIQFPQGDVEFKEPVFQPGFNNAQQGSREEKEAESKAIEREGAEEKKEYALKYPPGDYYKKVDFTAIKNQFEANVSELQAELAPVVDEQFEDIYDQIKKKKILGSDPKPDRIDSIKVKNLKKMELIYKKHFRQLYVNAQKQAATELAKGNYTQPLLADEFQEVLAAEIFKFIGDYEYKIKNFTKNELIKALKDGRPFSELVDILDSDGKNLSEVSLERWSRTKTTEVYNQGRKAFFDESGFVKAYQYSAIMDDATSEICSTLDGKIFSEKETGVVPTPPMHFNCRSLLIPITQFEEYKPTTRIGNKSSEDWITEKAAEAGVSVYSYERKEECNNH